MRFTWFFVLRLLLPHPTPPHPTPPHPTPPHPTPPHYFELAGREAIIDRVYKKKARPIFPLGVPPAYAALARACWDNEPLQRPTFHTVLIKLGEMLAAFTQANTGLPPQQQLPAAVAATATVAGAGTPPQPATPVAASQPQQQQPQLPVTATGGAVPAGQQQQQPLGMSPPTLQAAMQPPATVVANNAPIVANGNSITTT